MSATRPELTDPFEIGGVPIANRVLLAPLAGIGNWFVRLQAKRHGAGLAVSEMVSSFALHYRNERTLRELLVLHPEEHPVSIQLFGHDAEVMRAGAEIAAAAGADLIDINMGCPVPKVRKTGAGVQLLRDPDLAVALAVAAREGSGLPVTVKLRSGISPEDRSGFDLAVRLAEEAGVAAIGFHPRAATKRHQGRPDYALTRELAERLEVPVIVSGGLSSAAAARRAYEESGADAVMIARGSLGNPWVFEELTGRRAEPPTRAEVVGELLWILDRAEEHLGTERAQRYLRKFYPWYFEGIGASRQVRDELQRTADLARARELIAPRGRLSRSVSKAFLPPQTARYTPALPEAGTASSAVAFSGAFFGFLVRSWGPSRGALSTQSEVAQVSRQAVITPEGLEKLKEEIEFLTTTKRREVAARIKEAREFGDISENAEYDDAKNEQALLETRIAQLEERLRRTTVIDEKAIGTDEVGFGSVVHVKDQRSGDSQKFQIVGSTEANPMEHKLSNESPIGKALLGKKRNDIVTVEPPRGVKKKLKITKIEQP